MVAMAVVGIVQVVHFSDDVDNLVFELIVVLDAKGVAGIAEQPVRWALSVIAFNEQAVGGELVDVGVVGAIRIPGGFDFNGDEAFAAFEQVIGFADKPVVMVDQRGDVGECAPHVGSNCGAPWQPTLVAGTLGEPPNDATTEEECQDDGRIHGSHPYHVSASAPSPSTAMVMAMVRRS